LIDATPERWPRATWRALWHALWVNALIILAAAGAFLWANWGPAHYTLADLGRWAVFAAVLIAPPIVYRRQVPQAMRWPATKRAWLLTIPLVFVVALPVFLFFASNLRGAIPG